MSIRRVQHTVQERGRLDEVVRRWLEADLERPLSKGTVRRLIVAGLVRSNARPLVRPAADVDAGTRLRAAIDTGRLPRRDDGDRAAAITVLFEDDVLIAVAKPAGIPAHATADPGRSDLYTLVRQRLLGPGAYLGLHHRLDQDTSGVVLFTKRPDVNEPVAGQFARREVVKIYHAITSRPATAVTARWRTENRLGVVGRGRRARVGAVTEEGQQAVTAFRLLERLDGALLVEARPKTGRRHQIRAHLEADGMPIAGDVRYGGPTRVAGIGVTRVMLHAYCLELHHPLTGTLLAIHCPYASDFERLLVSARSSQEAPLRLDMSRPTR
jgi:23S rRNA pseudouridine955/2504/2580 synthase